MSGRRATWDVKTTKIFLDLCIDEKNKLNYCDNGLTRTGWHNLYSNFRRETSKTYDSKQLQNKFNTLKRKYKAWKKLKAKSGSGWDQSTGAINCDDDWWIDRIAENEQNKQFRDKPFPYEIECAVLFGSEDSDDDIMLCVGGIGDRTPSGGSEENLGLLAQENGASGVGRMSQKPGMEHVVDSPAPKKPKSMEYYVERISKSMMERSQNEKKAITREQEELRESLALAEHDGVTNRSELYFIATELFRSPTRREAYKCIHDPDKRIAWLRWTWENVKKK